MAVGFGSYEIARSGLFVNERGLFVTGHNIANVNTPGYVRQQAIIASAPYTTIHTKNGIQQIGLGADIEQIRQIRHTFLDNIYRQENITLGYWEARNKTFQDVQAILSEPMGIGLQSIMNQFWDSWQELSKEPDSLTIRAIVRQRGEALVHHINHMGAQLDKLQSDINSEIKVRIVEINQLTEQISNLNAAILRNEVSGDSANDLRDARNLAADKLTRLANIDIIEDQDGSMTITLGGYFLVTKDKNTNLYAGQTSASELFYVPMLEGTELEVPVKSGTLKGLLESRGDMIEASQTNNIVSKLKKQLNILVSTLVQEVNSLHRNGKTLDNPPKDGEDFFTAIKPGYPLEMGNIRLNANFSEPNGLNYIVASIDGAPGDNTIALSMAALRHVPFIAGLDGELSMDDYYRSIILDIGNKGAEAARVLESQFVLVQSADNNRQSIAGVSMDEEMSNMMKYKFAYDASSRAINVIDEMMETIISRMGIVGR